MRAAFARAVFAQMEINKKKNEKNNGEGHDKLMREIIRIPIYDFIHVLYLIEIKLRIYDD